MCLSGAPAPHGDAYDGLAGEPCRDWVLIADWLDATFILAAIQLPLRLRAPFEGVLGGVTAPLFVSWYYLDGRAGVTIPAWVAALSLATVAYTVSPSVRGQKAWRPIIAAYALFASAWLARTFAISFKGGWGIGVADQVRALGAVTLLIWAPGERPKERIDGRSEAQL